MGNKLGYSFESSTNLNEYENAKHDNEYDNQFDYFKSRTDIENAFVAGRKAISLSDMDVSVSNKDTKIALGAGAYFGGGAEVELGLNLTAAAERLGIQEDTEETRVHDEVKRLKKEGRI